MQNNSYTSQSLLIFLWNSNGLQKHKNELVATLHEKRIDIALIAETHFTTRTKFSIPGYHTISTPHPDDTAHAGAAIIIKSSLQFQQEPPIQEDYIQAAIIKLTIKHTPITIASVYCPPKHKINITQYEQFFTTLGHYFIVGGDLNAKNKIWGCRSNNPKGVSLHKTTNKKSFSIISPPNPTYWPTSLQKNPDILEIFITKLPKQLYSLIDNLLNPCSDHSPVLLSIDATPPIRPEKPSLTNGIMNWKKFQDDIQKQINLKTKLKSPDDIEDAVENLTSLIQNSAWNASTPIPAKPQSLNLPSYVRELIVQKRRARAAWQNNRLPSYKQAYNNLNAKLKRTLSKIRSDSFSSWTASLVAKNGSLWRATRNCLRQKITSYPLKNNDNTWCTSEIGKAELFRTHLATVFQPHSNISNPQFTEEVKDYLTTPLPVYLPPKAFSPNDISRCILSFPLRKSPGYDLITAEIARQLPKKAIILLTYIINSILRLSHFPLQWKLSIIVLFPKPDKPIENTSSYRPISLLPFFSKLCEKLILKRIMPTINEKQIVPDTQFGFRNSHSTIHQIHRLVDTISLTLEKKCTAPLYSWTSPKRLIAFGILAFYSN